jgi:hypothetical protein
MKPAEGTASTPLAGWLRRNGIPSARVESKLKERLLGRAPSRQQFFRWRSGRVDVQRKDMVRILWAVREVSGNSDVRVDELFDLDPASDENWRD